ncbi:MAG: DUF2723 domain-containing protein, partial [Candidatus Levybacteria bacterium]|nr:DUF2723 domain-containing protein [Candidatus Levybacteria bacterium]
MKIVLFFVLSCLYIFNLSRSVYGGDVGDLVTAAAVWGVAHPPGYPLFTVLGGILINVLAHFGQSPAFAVGIISALSASAGVVLFYTISLKLIKSRLASLIGALTLAFSYLYWFYAEIAEVFALNNLFVLLLILLAITYRQTQKIRDILLLAFFTGLSLTNHHTIILLFPTLLLLIGAPLINDIKAKRLLIIQLIVAGLLGFSIYVYVIFASLANPVIDWANIDSVRSFIDLVLRTKYGTFQLGQFAVESAMSKLIITKTYFQILLTQVTIPVVLLAAVGAASLFRKDKLLAISLAIGFVLSGPFFVSYAGFPLNNVFFFGVYERFLSMSSILVILFFPLGIVAFSSFMMKFFSRKEFGVLFIGIFLLIPLQLFIFNFPKTNLSQAFEGDDLGRNYLEELPQKSMVFLSGDTNLFNTWYVRYALKVRPDILLLNGGNLTQANSVFEKNMKIQKKVTPQESFKKFISNIKKKDLQNPVFSDTKFDVSDKSFSWIPYGLLFELRSPS